MDKLYDILYLLSSGLLVPVVIILIVLLAYSLVLCVLTFREHKQCALFLCHADSPQSSAINKLDMTKFSYIFQQLDANKSHPLLRERIIADLEVEMDRRLGPYRLLMKLGPMFGLMGTLIPMGPALTGLAMGSIDAMAYNMQVAFATTVVGILVAVLGALMLHAMQHQYAAMFNYFEYYNALLDEDGKEETAK